MKFNFRACVSVKRFIHYTSVFFVVLYECLLLDILIHGGLQKLQEVQ
jgi:hypothetical protein